jgi:hypothetical protein
MRSAFWKLCCSLLIWIGVAVSLPARADFVDDDSPHAAHLAARRHTVETRLVESWLRALGLDEAQVAERLAAMSDRDLHRTVLAPETLWAAGGRARR